jgi:REP element-mobilizing transposase RayT
MQSQLDFGFRTPPRKRKRKRGRPRKAGAGVPHLKREVSPRHPLHVTLRVRRHVWNLRARRCFRIIEAAFFAAAQRVDARIAQFSVQHDHVHMLVEAGDARGLGSAMQSMCIRVAKGLNVVMDRKGAVFADRYHSRSLRTPTEVRRALIYVLCNGRKHLPAVGHRLGARWIDPCSSGAWFDGWSVSPRSATDPPRATDPPPVRPAATWLLSTGWRERGGGPIRPDEGPGPSHGPTPPADRGLSRRW